MVTPDRIRLTGLLRKKPWYRGFFYGPGSPTRRAARKGCVSRDALICAGRGLTWIGTREPPPLPHAPQERVNAAQGARTAVRRAPVAPGLHASVLRLHREAGNRAVTGLLAVQRDVGWKKDGSTEGYKWNRDEHAVGKIRRI